MFPIGGDLRAMTAGVILFSACVPGSRPESIRQVRPSALSVRDAGDFYFVNGKPVSLDRAPLECVIGVAAETDLQAFLGNLAMRVRASEPVLVKDRRFVLLTLDAPRGTGSMERLFATLRARPDVWFVSPIYYQPDTRVRVIPTDDVIVKLASSAAPGSLAGILREEGLQQVSVVDGTHDQYVLRIAAAKNVDVLGLARRLYGSGVFEWVEPDFIQERRR